MIVIDCPRCGHRELVGTRRINSLHNTDAGPVAELTCSKGHELLYDFHRQQTVAVAELV